MIGVNFTRRTAALAAAAMPTPTGTVRRHMSSGRGILDLFGDGGRAGTADSIRAAEDTHMRFVKSLDIGISSREMLPAGVTVDVAAGTPGKAYARLNRIITENNVRRELMLRKRYEKPKYKRQRLRFESHARRFKEEVQRNVHLVKKMKNWGM
ncbi:hypothetical protein EV175_004449 [Coemansia sp. RSA 1933]|nr:hypothetical protein EV175_004449 [Coemansia sp. RSA 1933]